MAKFHNYSFNNTLLIAMQGGQLVAGFNKWKDTFHRTVKKGEKGIKILAPAPYKVKWKNWTNRASPFWTKMVSH